MFLAGFANAFANNLQRDRELNSQLTEQRQQRENAILTHLSTSDDPEIASRAIAGLMDQAAGRRPLKGIRGFLSETEGNPALPAIRNLIMAGKGGSTLTGAPATPGSMAQPSGSAVTPAQPSPINPEAAAGPGPTPPPGPESIGTNVGRPGPTPESAPIMASAAEGSAAPAGAGATGPAVAGPASVSPASTGPRQVFLTKAQQAGATEEATVRGKINAFRGAFPGNPQLEQTAILGAAGIRPPMTGQFMGNIQRDGQWYRQERIFNPDTASYTIQEVPIAAPTALQQKPTYKPLADPQTGRPALFSIDAQGNKQKIGDLAVKDQRITWTDENNQVHSDPVSSIFEQPRQGGSAVQPPPSPGASTAPAATGPSPVGASSPSGAAATPPPGPQPATPTTVRPATGASGNRGNVLGRTKSTAQPVEGAFIGPNGTPVVGTALYDATRKMYFDPQNPTQPIQGFIPGKESIEQVKTIANANTVKTTIQRALDNIHAQGLDNDDDPATTARLAEQYKSGKAGDDPLVPAFNALADFTKIQGASQYVQGTRAFRYIQQIQQHLPLLPSAREAVASSVTGGAIGPLTSQMVGGGAWDSPKQMRIKLEQASQNLDNIVNELQKASGKTPDRALGGTTPPPGPGGAPAGGRGAAPGGAASSQPGQGTIYAYDPSGQKHSAPAGTPLPAGWALTTADAPPTRVH